MTILSQPCLQRPAAFVLTTFWLAAAAHGGEPPLQVMIELEAAPAAQVYATQLAAGADRQAAVAGARRQLERVEVAQALLLPRLRTPQINARPLFRVQRVYNGISALVDATDLTALRTLPGVAAVHPVIPKTRTNSTSVPMIGAPAVWDASGPGLTGLGIRIGIIDTGIDYLHTDFGGSGLGADYGANDTTSLADGFFPTAKVAGGWDFVGDGYDAASSNPAARVPAPDPDPADCEGHGTHVAGTAAGFGVEASGATYGGPYGPATPFASLMIGPGVAPEATLYALRVFGCSGATAVVEQALEWAVDPDGNGDFSDHLDVVNLSLTSPYAAADDPTAVAADNAVLAGVIVVAAAGNDFNNFFITGSPGVAERAISAAASWDSDPAFPGLGARVDAPPALAGTHQAGGAAFGPAPGTLSGSLVAAVPLDACLPLINLPPEIDGKIALIAKSDACSAVTQVRHAQNAGTTGAVAAMLYNDTPGLAGLLDDGTGGDITIPSLLIRQTAGEDLLAALPGVDVTLDSVLLGDVAGSFSSRGPRRAAPLLALEPEVVLKPDLAAPGVAITSARRGTPAIGGTDAKLLSGTSMASPHIAGMMALLRQQHPTWSVAELKAAAMNTAGDLYLDPEATPPRVGPSQMGAGRLRPDAARQVEAIAFDRDAPARVSVSFGALEVVGAASYERTVRLQSKGNGAVSYEAAIDDVVTVPGVAFDLPDGSLLKVPAGGSSNLRITLEVDAGLMRHTVDPAYDTAFLGIEKPWLSEAMAYLVLTPTAGGESEPLRLPLYAAVRPAAAMGTTAGALELPSGPIGIISLPLAGSDLDTGVDFPVDERSLVTALALQQIHLRDPGQPAAADLAYVGVASDAAAQLGGLTNSEIYFGVATHGDASTPNVLRVEIYIDSDDDGSADYLLYSSDEGSFTYGTVVTDGFRAVLRDLGDNSETLQAPLNVFSPAALHTVPYLTDVRVLAVRAADLGLGPGASTFRYGVAVSLRSGDNDTAERPGRGVMPSLDLRFDPAAPGLDTSAGSSGPPTYPDLDGTLLTIGYNLLALAADNTLGLLLLHHHNGRGTRAEVITVRAALFADGFESGDTSAWSATVP